MDKDTKKHFKENASYRIVDFDPQNRVVFVVTELNESLTFQLPMPCPTCIEELDAVIVNFMRPQEEFDDTIEPVDLSFIWQHKGKAREVKRRKLIPDVQVPLEAAILPDDRGIDRAYIRSLIEEVMAEKNTPPTK